MSIWNLLKDSYPEGGGDLNQNAAMTALIDNYLTVGITQNVESFQDFAFKGPQDISKKFYDANNSSTGSGTYATYNSSMLKAQADAAASDSRCLTDSERTESVLSKNRTELYNGLKAFIEAMIKAEGSFAGFATMTEVQMKDKIKLLPCSDNYNRGLAQAFLNDVIAVLEQNTFEYIITAELNPPPPEEEILIAKKSKQSKTSMETSSLLLSDVYVTSFINHSVQIVNHNFTASLATQGTISISQSATFTTSFKLVNELAIPAPNAPYPLTAVVIDNYGATVSTTIISVVPGNVAPQLIIIPPPVIPPPPTFTTIEMYEVKRGELDTDLKNWLNTNNISTLAGISKIGGLKYTYNGPITGGIPNQLKELDSFASLDRIYPNDIAVSNALYVAYTKTDSMALSLQPRSTYVTKSNVGIGGLASTKAGYIGGAQTFLSNKLSERFLSNVGVGVLTDFSNGGIDAIGYLTPTIKEKIKLAFVEKCMCTDCEAATSPLAYLAELINYTTSYVRKNDGFVIELAFLETNFRQPFGSVINNCSSMEEEICYARVSIEILRRYYTTFTPDAGFVPSVQQYCISVYNYFLNVLGISYGELTIKKDSAPDNRKSYTESLGLYYSATDPANEILNRLWKDTSVLGSVTEAYLEEMFGLQDTTRDGASTGLKTGDTGSILKLWNFDGYDFQNNTDENGFIYITVTKPLSSPTLIKIYKNSEKDDSSLVAEGSTELYDGNVRIIESSLSGLSGWVKISGITTDTIKISLIPRIVCSQLRKVKSDWKAIDADSIPFIDPDIITLNDIRNPYAIGTENSAAKIWSDRKASLTTKYNNILTGSGGINTQKNFYDGPRTGSEDPLSLISYRAPSEVPYYIGLYKDGSTLQLRKYTRPETGTPSPAGYETATGTNGNLYHNTITKGLYHVSSADGFINKINPENLIKTWTIDDYVYPINSPKDMCEDDKGNIIIADSGNNRIVKFKPATKWKSGDYVLFNNLQYFVVETSNSRITKYGLSGDRLATFGYNFAIGQVGRWLFYNNIVDLYGHVTTGEHQAYTNAASGSLSPVALLLNGTNAFLTVASATDIDTNTIGYIERSYRFKFNINNKDLSTSKQVIYSQGNDDRGMNIYVHAGRLYAGIWNDNIWEEFVYTDAIQNKKWHEVVISLLGSTSSNEKYANGFRIYIDGKLLASTNGYKLEAASSGSAINIGAAGKTRFHDGKQSKPDEITNHFGGAINEFWLWNRSLSDQDALLLFNQQFNPLDPKALLTTPSKVIVDSKGNVILLDTATRDFTIFNALSEVVYQYKFSNTYNPVDIVLDENENILILDGSTTGRLWLYVYGAVSPVDKNILGLISPKCIIKNINNNYYIVNNNGTNIMVLSDLFVVGSPITTYSYSSSGYPANWLDSNNIAGFSSIASICYDKSGNLIIVDSGYNRIVKLSPAGTYIDTWGKNNSSYSAHPNPLFDVNSLSKLSIDSDQNLYIKATSSIAGVAIYSFAMPNAWGSDTSLDPYYKLSSPSGIDVDENGFIYVVDSSSSQLRIYNFLGKIEGVGQPSVTIPEGTPKNLRIDRLGNIFLNLSTKLVKINEAGTILKEWTSYKLDDVGSDLPLNDVRSITFDRQYGSLFFTRPSVAPIVINNNNNFGKSIHDGLGLDMADFMDIQNQRKQKIDINPRLNELYLTFTSFDFLISVINSPLKADDISKTAYTNILVNHYKKVLYNKSTDDGWKNVEKLANIYLSPDIFVNHPQYSQDGFELQEWRGTEKERENFVNALASRVDALTTIIDANKNIVSNTEDNYLYILRDVLVSYSKIAGATPSTLEEKAAKLSAKFLNDFEMNCCQKTTRLTQAIETIQLFVWTIRTGQISSEYKLYSIDSDHFDDEWKWMGSYATWRAAVFVFVYPENLLDPRLRKIQSNPIKKAISAINDNPGFSPEHATEIANEYQNYIDDVAGLKLQDAVETNLFSKVWNGRQDESDEIAKNVTIVFATGSKTNTIYYSIQGADISSAVWNPIEGTANTDQFVSAKQCYYQSNRHVIVSFTRFEEKVKKLFYCKFDLDKGTWLGEAKEMGDVGAPDYDIIGIRHEFPWSMPAFFINYREYDGKFIYSFHMTADGKGIEKIDFSEVFLTLPGAESDKNKPELRLKGLLRGAVAISTQEETLYYLVLGSKSNASIYQEKVYTLKSTYNSVVFWRQIYQTFNNNDNSVLLLSNSSPSNRLTGSFVSPDKASIVFLFSCKNYVEYKLSTKTRALLNNQTPNTEKIILPTMLYPRDSNSESIYKVIVQTGSLTNNLIHTNDLIFKTPTLATVKSLKLLDDPKPKQIQPLITKDLKAGLLTNQTNLQRRKGALYQAYEKLNKGVSDSVLLIIEEGFFHLPMLIANALSQGKYYVEALDWYRTIYDYNERYNADSAERARKIFYGLVLDEGFNANAAKPDDWLSDPLNPHAIAKSRPKSYTKYTLMSIVNCMLDYADSEFTKDNVESVAKARVLYETSLLILENEGLMTTADQCSKYIRTNLLFNVSLSYWKPIWDNVKEGLNDIHDFQSLKSTITAINLLSGTDDVKIKQAHILIQTAIQNESGISNIADISITYATLAGDINRILIGETSLRLQSDSIIANTASTFYSNVEAATAVTQVQLNDSANKLKFDWMANPAVLVPVTNASGIIYVDTVANGMTVNVSLAKELNWTNSSAKALPESFQFLANNKPYVTFKDISVPYSFNSIYNFCMPKNPVKDYTILRAEINLYKIRNCMNISGMVRELNPFAAATDTVTGMPSIGGNGRLILPGIGAPLPTIYKYSFLIERAKQLANIAQQSEATYLSLLQNSDNEAFQLLQAKQAIRSSEQTVKLQDLRVTEADQNVELAGMQVAKATEQSNYFAGLVSQNLTKLETALLTLKSVAVYLSKPAKATGKAATVEEATKVGPFGKMGNIAAATLQAMATDINLLGVEADLLGLLASNERRLAEWRFQSNIAKHDKAIAEQGKKIAETQLKVVKQERTISEIQLQHAEDSMEFLQNKFTNKQLYTYMSRIMGNVYSYFLNRATSMAKLAETQLAFERQNHGPVFIGNDYFADVSNGASLQTSGEAQYKGLTGSSRLIQDIYRLDEYAIEKDVNEVQLSKTISVGQLYPEQLETLRRDGKMTFSTPMELFDRDFPGQYRRLIKNVKVSTIALVPSTGGINASLVNNGISKAVITSNTTNFTVVPVVKQPQSISFTGSQNATGVLDLQPINGKLVPFEGLGVDTSWQFIMPKFNNFFEFDTIADVLLTIEYSALENNIYKQQVLKKLGTDVNFSRMFSLKSNFPDQWYDMSNAQNTLQSRFTSFDVYKSDFPANVEVEKVNDVGVMFVTDQNKTINAKVSLNFTQSSVTKNGTPVSLKNGIAISTDSNASSLWSSLIFNGTPFGTWTLTLNSYTDPDADPIMDKTIADYFNEDRIKDILVVISYGGKVAAHPEQIIDKKIN